MAKFNSMEMIFEIIINLSKNQVSGLTNKELAQIVDTSESNMCKYINIFEKYKWIIRGSRSVWRLSSDFGKIGVSIAELYEDAKLRFEEEEARECLRKKEAKERFEEEEILFEVAKLRFAEEEARYASVIQKGGMYGKK